MKLKEAIDHAKMAAHVAWECGRHGCAEEHEQLATWLEELLVFRERARRELAKHIAVCVSHSEEEVEGHLRALHLDVFVYAVDRAAAYNLSLGPLLQVATAAARAEIDRHGKQEE